jgi:uncharacterized protein YhfF/GNAT superfamily N-acetyltransferase
MSFSVRLATFNDIPAMHRARNSVRENRLSDLQRISESSYVPFVEAGTAWVAERNGEIAGFAVLDTQTGSVWALFIAPDAEGRGLGRALHQAIVGQAKKLYMDELWLSTSAGTRAARFYTEAGWEHAGTTPEGELIFKFRVNAARATASSVEQLWRKFRKANPEAPDAVPNAFHFCDNPVDADLCVALVLSGAKRATATSLAELELAGAPIPRPGDYAVVTNWLGEAQAVIRTSSVTIKRFCEIDEAFAEAEGEGDRTLDWWRSAHRAYYQRVLAGNRYKVDEKLELACEYFEVLMKA